MLWKKNPEKDLANPIKSRYLLSTLATLIALLVKNLPAMQETLVQFLGLEDPVEKRWTTHYSILGLPLWLT